MRTRGRFAALRRARGFSLLELAVVLVIVGAMGAVLWRVLPQWRPAAEGDPVARDLLLAEQALQGFVLSAHRLPCPDNSADRDGLEHCDGQSVGNLPTRTLGLPVPLGNLRYGVQRGSGGGTDLTEAISRQVPRLPPGSASLVVNGLDFCVALQQAQNGVAGPGFSVDGEAVAFALAHPGSEDRDGDGDLFDGANKNATFAMPGTPESAAYDDRTIAVGFGELAVRLDCMQRLGIANGAARAAYAAYDEDRFAAMYVEFRGLALEVRRDNTDRAITVLTLASVDLAIAVATSASAIALALASAGAASGPAAGAVLAVSAATASVVSAALALDTARDAEAVAVLQLGAANAFRTRTIALLAAARARAIERDEAGLQP